MPGCTVRSFSRLNEIRPGTATLRRASKTRRPEASNASSRTRPAVSTTHSTTNWPRSGFVWSDTKPNNGRPPDSDLTMETAPALAPANPPNALAAAVSGAAVFARDEHSNGGLSSPQYSSHDEIGRAHV